MSEPQDPAAPGDGYNAALLGSRLIDRVLAVKLTLASREIALDQHRLLRMIDWILENDGEQDPNGGMPTRVFIEAIKATKP